MAKIYSKALDRYLEADRILGKIQGTKPGPTVIFTAGIHGNEPAGVFALQIILGELSKLRDKINGSIYCLTGNLTALEKGIRYDQQDLNRIWNADRIKSIEKGACTDEDNETREQIALYHTLQTILKKETGPYFFIDLHTTSSETIPFLTVNDSMINRKYTEKYPLPIILGIEEYLQGPLLSYINELGYVAFGFEGGQHDALASVENHVSFVYLSLVYAGLIQQTDINFFHHFEVLAKHAFIKGRYYEIDYRYEINPEDMFTMKPGFVNFQKIKKHEPMATHNGTTVLANSNGRILMPQYQKMGTDGFFTIKKTSTFFLKLSAFLRTLKADTLLTLLPGVKWASKKHDTILVNQSIARYYSKQIFHLFGYRSRTLDSHQLLMKNRELPSRKDEYKI